MERDDDADLAVLDMALDEALGRASPPDLWSRLAGRRTPPPIVRRTWLAAAAALLGFGVVVGITFLRPDAVPASDPTRIDVHSTGPATLDELLVRMRGADHVVLTAHGTWSDELQEWVPLARMPFDDWFRWGLRPKLEADDGDAITSALANASAGPVLNDVVWTHQFLFGSARDGCRVLLRTAPGHASLLAFASPRGAVALHAPALPFAAGESLLAETTRTTIEQLGFVIGRGGFAAISPGATKLRLYRVPGDLVHELDRLPKLQGLELTDAPEWHSTAVLHQLASKRIRSLVLRPDWLAADAWPALGSMASLRELFLVGGHPFAIVFGTGQAPPAPGLDDAAVRNLGNLPELEELTLAGGSFHDEGLRALAALPKLRSLHLMGNRNLTGSSLPAFAGVTQLTAFDCTAMRGEFVTAIGLMPQLKELVLMRSTLEPAELSRLAACASLRSLTLGLTPPLRDADLIWLHGLGQVTKLDLLSDQISEDGLRSLRDALPGCTVKVERVEWW